MVTRNIQIEFEKEKTTEYVKQTLIKFGQKIRIKLFSPVFNFSNPEDKLIDDAQITTRVIGIPKDTCEPGVQKILVSVLDVDTKVEIESLTISVKVVDYVFGLVSRPLISKVSTVVLGIGSFAMFVLTFLDQIDKTVGLTSGTAAGFFAVGIYGSFYNLYQRVRPNMP